jgi:hypothetical protein
MQCAGQNCRAGTRDACCRRRSLVTSGSTWRRGALRRRGISGPHAAAGERAGARARAGRARALASAARRPAASSAWRRSPSSAARAACTAARHPDPLSAGTQSSVHSATASASEMRSRSKEYWDSVLGRACQARPGCCSVTTSTRTQQALPGLLSQRCQAHLSIGAAGRLALSALVRGAQRGLQRLGLRARLGGDGLGCLHLCRGALLRLPHPQARLNAASACTCARHAAQPAATTGCKAGKTSLDLHLTLPLKVQPSMMARLLSESQAAKARQCRQPAAAAPSAPAPRPRLRAAWLRQGLRRPPPRPWRRSPRRQPRRRAPHAGASSAPVGGSKVSTEGT